MEKEEVMEKIGIEKIRCFNPLGFYACWMVVLWWITLRFPQFGKVAGGAFGVSLSIYAL